MRQNSKRPSKQRKFLVQSPLHVKQKFVGVHLSKDLRKKYRKRSFGIRKGDRVIVTTGSFKKHTGKVERVDLKKTRIFVSGAEMPKKDGTKRMVPINPSNLMIIELNMDDKLRQKILEVKNV